MEAETSFKRHSVEQWKRDPVKSTSAIQIHTDTISLHSHLDSLDCSQLAPF